MSRRDDNVVDIMGLPAPGFDVREYAREAAGSYRDGLNLPAYVENPLSGPTLRVLRYLHIVERATMTHLRSVLVTATHKDARITAFLTTWAFEKYWIADALEQVVLAHAPDGTKSGKSVFRTPVERTIRESIVANIIGLPMIAVHMSLGAVDEWLTQAAYARISEIEKHGQLSTMINGFLVVKRRQLSFFEAQARFRLADSKQAMAVTRRRLARTPWPIGATAEPPAETAFFFEHIFGPVPQLVTALDGRIDTLPGQSGMSLIGKANLS